MGTPKSSILIGFFTINHSFWGTPICGNHHVYTHKMGHALGTSFGTNQAKISEDVFFCVTLMIR